MAKGRIEVSDNSFVPNSSRPSNIMTRSHTVVEENVSVKDAVALIREHNAVFVRYVNSVRSGCIAVYVHDGDNGRVSLRLKDFDAKKLHKIHKTTQKKVAKYAH